MKIRSLFILLFASILIFTCKQQPKEASTEIEVSEEVVKDLTNVIVEANQVFITHFNNHDGAAIGQLYTENGRLFPTNSKVIEGREAIGQFWNSIFEMGIDHGELTTVHVENFGDTAVEEGAYKLFDGENNQLDEGKYIIVWKDVDGQWQLDRDIFNTSMPAPQ